MQSVVKMDGSGRLTLRTRQHLKPFTPYYSLGQSQEDVNDPERARSEAEPLQNGPLPETLGQQQQQQQWRLRQPSTETEEDRFSTPPSSPIRGGPCGSDDLFSGHNSPVSSPLSHSSSNAINNIIANNNSDNSNSCNVNNSNSNSTASTISAAAGDPDAGDTNPVTPPAAKKRGRPPKLVGKQQQRRLPEQSTDQGFSSQSGNRSDSSGSSDGSPRRSLRHATRPKLYPT